MSHNHCELNTRSTATQFRAAWYKIFVSIWHPYPFVFPQRGSHGSHGSPLNTSLHGHNQLCKILVEGFGFSGGTSLQLCGCGQEYSVESQVLRTLWLCDVRTNRPIWRVRVTRPTRSNGSTKQRKLSPRHVNPTTRKFSMLSRQVTRSAAFPQSWKAPRLMKTSALSAACTRAKTVLQRRLCRQ